MFTVILGDVEVYELCHWALMNRSFGSGCDGYKGGGVPIKPIFFSVSISELCFEYFFSSVVLGYWSWQYVNSLNL